MKTFLYRLKVPSCAAISFVAAIAACTSGVDPTNPAEVSTANPQQPRTSLTPDWKEKAVHYLDGRAKDWLVNPPNVANIKCAMSCHTTFPTLIAFGKLGVSTPGADTLRARFEARVTEAKSGSAIPFYGQGTDPKVAESHATESVLNAVAITFDDLSRNKAISAAGKNALGHMWSQQGTDGSWQWLDFGLEPWETRNDWGVGMAALLIGSIPPNTTTGQTEGTAKLKAYIAKHLEMMALHERVTVLWASGSMKDLLTSDDVASIAQALIAKQSSDGGFALRSWGKGTMGSAGAKSDGYATALAALALCTGTPEGATRIEVVKAMQWLAANQLEDGSWPGQALDSNTERARRFMTDAATAYAAMAITTCRDRETLGSNAQAR